MRFGLFFLPVHSSPGQPSVTQMYAGLVANAARAEQLGLDSVWFAEHHFSRYGGMIPNIAVLGAAVAARTSTVRIGSAATILPLRDAVETAESLAMLDHLSGGRLDVGVGRGFLPLEFAGRGVDLAERSSLFTEGLDVLLGAWKPGAFSYQGRHYRLDDVEVLPKPRQQPPPVWVAASTSRESFELAGSRGFHLMLNPYTRTPAELEAGLAAYRRARSAAGFDPRTGRVLVNQHVFVAPTETEAREVPRGPLLDYLAAVNVAFGRPAGTGAEATAGPGGPLAPDTYDAMYPDRVLFGTPDRVVAKLKDWERFGATDISLMAHFGDLPVEAADRSLRLFAREVAPCFR